jgi:ABC-type Fe3+/spermidine/putrescine transport system ATPase subunit
VPASAASSVSGVAPALSVHRLRKSFGAVVAVDGVSLDAAPGEFLSLLGPSGCGKTTLLRMVAGLVEPDSGDIRLAGEDVTRRPVHRRNLGLVFQSYALFPHMTVFENVAFGLRRRGVHETALGQRVERMLELVRLGPLGTRHPRELSGGQQQRVALARALVTEPRVLLLDEPLSNLDALLRDEMRVELKRLQERLGTTMIFVTHDQAEALILSDRVVVMESGRVEQVGRPEEVYRRPATPFVARFLGRANFLAGSVAAMDEAKTVVALDGGNISVVAGPRPDLLTGQRVHVVIRQESIRIGAPGASATCPNDFVATVVFHAFAGQAHHYVVQLPDGREIDIAAPGATVPLARGARARVEWQPEDVILLASSASNPDALP